MVSSISDADRGPAISAPRQAADESAIVYAADLPVCAIAVRVTLQWRLNAALAGAVQVEARIATFISLLALVAARARRVQGAGDSRSRDPPRLADRGIGFVGAVERAAHAESGLGEHEPRNGVGPIARFKSS